MHLFWLTGTWLKRLPRDRELPVRGLLYIAMADAFAFSGGNTSAADLASLFTDSRFTFKIATGGRNDTVTLTGSLNQKGILVLYSETAGDRSRYQYMLYSPIPFTLGHAAEFAIPTFRGDGGTPTVDATTAFRPAVISLKMTTTSISNIADDESGAILSMAAFFIT